MSVDQMNKYFEKAIIQSPELYGWEYKKFRKLSGSIKNIYKLFQYEGKNKISTPNNSNLPTIIAEARVNFAESERLE